MDVSSITQAVNDGLMLAVAGLIAIASLLMAVSVAMSGARFILSMIRGGGYDYGDDWDGPDTDELYERRMGGDWESRL